MNSRGVLISAAGESRYDMQISHVVFNRLCIADHMVMLYIIFVMMHFLVNIWTPGRLAVASVSANGDPFNKQTVDGHS